MLRLLGFEPSMYAAFSARFERMRRFYRLEALAPFEGVDRASAFARRHRREAAAQRPRAGAPVALSRGKTILPDYILTLLGDRMEMAHSVEGRVPFLDHEVGEFLWRTPVNMKIRGTTEKYILREATRDVLTDTVYKRQKHPFLSPPETAGRRSRMSELIRDTLRSDAARSVPFFQADEVRSFADELDETSALRARLDRYGCDAHGQHDPAARALPRGERLAREVLASRCWHRWRFGSRACRPA